MHGGAADRSGMYSVFVCLFVCLFNRSLRVATYLGPDGTRLEQNAQGRLKGLYKHAGKLVYGNVTRKRETDLKIWNEGKEDQGHSQQIKLNNFNISLWDKRKEILYPISTTTVASDLICLCFGILSHSIWNPYTPVEDFRETFHKGSVIFKWISIFE